MTRFGTSNKPSYRRPFCVTAAAFAGALAWLAAPALLRAEEPALPDAATVLDKYVEVTGGKAAYEKLENRVIKGRIVHVGMGFEDKVVIYDARPNLRYFEADSEVLGDVRQGCDGKVAWYVSANTGAFLEEGDAAATALREAHFDILVQWRDLYAKAECVGEEDIDGKPCYKLILTPDEGEPETRFYDKQSGLLVRVNKTRLSSIAGAIPLELTFGDYKRVDGILMPHKSNQAMTMCGSKREMLVVADSIEHNVQLPENRFEPPKEIQALIAKQHTDWLGRLVGKIAAKAGGSSRQGAGCSGSKSSGSAGGGSGKPASHADQKQTKRPSGGCAGG